MSEKIVGRPLERLRSPPEGGGLSEDHVAWLEGQGQGRVVQAYLEDLVTMAPKTRRIYVQKLRQFLEHHEIGIEELYVKRMADLKSQEPMDRREVERWVKLLMAEMEEAGSSASTCRQVAKAVGFFLENMGPEFELRLKARKMPQAEANGQRMATQEAIWKMYDSVGSWNRERNRALIMFAKDSGLRVSDISALNVGDWAAARDHMATAGPFKGKIFKVFDPSLTRKCGILAHVHVGPEAVEELSLYLSVRDLESGSGHSPEDPLFLGRDGGRASPSALSNILFRLGGKTGQAKVSAHSLRKFHRTALEGAGVPVGWILKLEGKKADVYVRPEDFENGELTEAYVGNYVALCVKPETRRREFDELEDDLGILRARLQDLEAENERLRARELSVVALNGQVQELMAWKGFFTERMGALPTGPVDYPSRAGVETDPGFWRLLFERRHEFEGLEEASPEYEQKLTELQAEYRARLGRSSSPET